MVDVNSTTLHKFTIYETKTRLYIVGSNLSDDGFRILKIDRMVDPALGLSLVWDDVLYTKTECVELLARIDTGNKGTGGLTKVMAAFGIVGFVKFVEGYYLCVVTKRKAIALLGGHNIYHLEATALLKIENNTTANARSDIRTDEARYLSIFNTMDLTKNFYFSYTYDLTNSLQTNLANLKKGHVNLQGPYQDRFVWNQYLLSLGFGSDCLSQPNNGWVLPLIHGFLDQAKISVLGRSIYVTLIARRSRHFAGTRFLKRGANFLGDVANEVETEQIVNDNLSTPLFQFGKKGLVISPRYTSYLQHRGSIPLTWGQDISTMAPKPPIHLAVRDPFAVKAARHFNDLLVRYGAPLIVLNLIKAKEKTPRESKLLKEFTDDVNYLINCLKDKRKLVYIPWDMSRASKSKDQDVISYLEELAEDAMVVTKFCHSGPEPYAWYLKRSSSSRNVEPQYESLRQTGIVRTNCIDCIDRTNAAQFLIGKGALAHQLHALGILDEPNLPFDCDAVDMLTEMYHDHGDTLALQYGGSNLVNTMATYRKINQNWTSHSRDIVEAIRRFYTNSFVDAERQEAINLFLGVFRPSSEDKVKLWDLPTDYYLHNPPMDIINTTRPSYITWWESQPELTKLKQNKVPVPIQTYWDEHYRPHLFTSFSRLLSFNLNSTAHIGHRPNSSQLTSTTTSESEDVPDSVSPFYVHKSLTPQPLSTTVTSESVSADTATVGRFNRWFPNTNTFRSNTNKSKSRRPGGREMGGNLRTLSSESTFQLPSDVERILAKVTDPTLDKETSQQYHNYLDTSHFYHEPIDSGRSSEQVHKFERSIKAGQGTLDPISSSDRKLYLNHTHTLKNVDDLTQFSTANPKPKVEAYRQYLKSGKFNPVIEGRTSTLGMNQQLSNPRELRESRTGANLSTSSFASALPNLFTSLSTPT